MKKVTSDDCMLQSIEYGIFQSSESQTKNTCLIVYDKNNNTKIKGFLISTEHEKNNKT